MRRVVEAIAEATNLAFLVREESQSKELRTAADKILVKLSAAVDVLTEMRAKDGL